MKSERSVLKQNTVFRYNVELFQLQFYHQAVPNSAYELHCMSRSSYVALKLKEDVDRKCLHSCEVAKIAVNRDMPNFI